MGLAPGQFICYSGRMELKHTNGSPAKEIASTAKQRVLYIDTDQSGVVYHASYFRWLEAGRANYMRRRGIPYKEVELSGLALPITEAHMQYLKPARYDDIIEVVAWISDIGRAQARFEYQIFCGEVELIRAYTHHAAVNKKGKPTRLPAHIKDALLGPETVQVKEPRP